MPHKRASGTRHDKARRATDVAPIEHEPIPKSVSRVLDAGRIRREYRKKKHQLDGVGASSEPQRKKRRQDASDEETTALRIKPSETVTQFNRRVESRMMPLIKTALRGSSAQARKVRREEAGLARDKQPAGVRTEGSNKGSDPPMAGIADEMTRVAKEFTVVSTCAPRRLNDIAQEPPVISTRPRGAPKNNAGPPVSMVQKAMMAEERDKAIRRYRELKARKLRVSGGLERDG